MTTSGVPALRSTEVLERAFETGSFERLFDVKGCVERVFHISAPAGATVGKQVFARSGRPPTATSGRTT